MSNNDVFHVLNEVDASEFKKDIKVSSKTTLSYLSWTDAMSYVLDLYPDMTWEVHEFPMVTSRYELGTRLISDGDGTGHTESHKFPVETIVQNDLKVPYLKDRTGCYVKVSVTINNRTRTEILPVMDNRNNTVHEPDSFQINTSIKRCLAKALALHGLGLYIYRGEDLPTAHKEKKELTVTEVKHGSNKS